MKNIATFLNRTAIVTGAGGVIGIEICRFLAEAGVRVFAADLQVEPMKERFAPLLADGLQFDFIAYDISSAEMTREVVEQIIAETGTIDILVNNAGFRRTMLKGRPELARRLHAANIPQDIWKKMFDVNLGGVMIGMQAVLPHMAERKYGRIINIASIAGEVGLPGYAEYSASKAGVIGLTRTVAMEYAKLGITVNSVSPGIIEKHPEGRVLHSGTWTGVSGIAEDVARAVVFFAADEAGFITGVDLPVEGGRILGPHNCDM